MDLSTTIMCGAPGHEFECVIRIEEYGLDNYIPEQLFQAVSDALPEDWYTENRGSRLEAHPPRERDANNRAIPTTQAHGDIVAEACKAAGLTIDKIMAWGG